MVYRPLIRNFALFLGTLLAWSVASGRASAADGADTREVARILISSIPADSRITPTAAELAKVRVWMAFSLDALPTITQLGLKNLFETGTSSASSNLTNRRAIEDGSIGRVLPTELGDLRPKYAFLLHEDAYPVNVMTQYGSVFLEFSSDAYDRTTFSYGDSLDTGASLRPLSKHPVDPVEVRSLFKGFGYAEAQIWGTLGIEDVVSVIIPSDLDPKALKKLLAQAHAWGFGVKSFEPGTLKALDVRRLKTLLPPRLQKSSARPRLFLPELRALYREQDSVPAKCAVVSEIGLYPAAESGPLLDEIQATEKRALSEMKTRLPNVPRSEFLALHRKTLAYETLFVQITSARNRRTRVRNSAARLAQDPKSSPSLRAAAEKIASRYAGPAEGIDPEHLLWRSQRGETWTENERRAIREAFQAPDWRIFGLTPTTGTTRIFMREFDRQIPRWWREDSLFTHYLEKADWELEYSIDEWTAKWRTEDPSWRLHLKRLLKERRAKLESENLTGAVFRAVSALISRMDREFPNDCPATLRSAQTP
jgi:hypothetical protein